MLQIAACGVRADTHQGFKPDQLRTIALSGCTPPRVRPQLVLLKLAAAGGGAGQGVVKTGRKMLGETKPSESAPGTIRGDFCVDIGRCAFSGTIPTTHPCNEAILSTDTTASPPCPQTPPFLPCVLAAEPSLDL